MFEQLGLIGCGLMGGSLAMALRKAGLVKRIVGYSKSPVSSQLALKMQVIDAAAPDPGTVCQGSDLIVMAVPVAASESVFRAIAPHLQADVLLMDLGSTKRNVVDAARRTLREAVTSFVPCHPIAGRELAGVEHADPELYGGHQIILTPIPRTDEARLRQAEELWQALDCQTAVMTPEQHDASFAAVSHLPHLLAFALINGIMSQSQGHDYLALAGPGFRDFSRIAASDPDMWRDVLLANREELATQLKCFREALETLENRITSGQANELRQDIARASLARSSLKKTHVKSPGA